MRVLDDSGGVVFSAQNRQPPLHSPEERDSSVLQNFNAYSAAGRAQVLYWGRSVGGGTGSPAGHTTRGSAKELQTKQDSQVERTFFGLVTYIRRLLRMNTCVLVSFFNYTFCIS